MPVGTSTFVVKPAPFDEVVVRQGVLDNDGLWSFPRSGAARRRFLLPGKPLAGPDAPGGEVS